MRITIRLNETLMGDARKRAAEEGRSLTALIEEAVRRLLSQPRERKGYRLKPITKHGTRVPQIDVADRNALYDRMEGRE
jgi:ribbon-helix-helix CopG family protein